MDAFLWGAFGWCSVDFLGLRSCWHVWLFGHSVGGLFECTQNFFFLFEGLHAFLRGVNDGFNCCDGILIILLFSFFFSFLF